MNINEILSGVDCKCGKRHTSSIEKVYIEKGAAARLGELCADYSTVLVVADENTYGAGGEKVKAALSDKKITEVIFDGKSVLIPDQRAIERVTENLSGIEMIIALGSGVIQDLCKYVSHFNKIPYIDVATAPSMDGYASVGAALILGGMKVTLNARVPEAIIADTSVLAKAPMDMIIAGYGDIIGKYSCLSDWRLAALVRGEYICDYVVRSTYEVVDGVRKAIDGIKKRDSAAIGKLMAALVAVGILMAYVGNSRPASGSEHHLSHFFEIIGIERDEAYLPHGTDVFYSSALTARIRDELLRYERVPKPDEFSIEKYENDIKRIYGSLADEVIALQRKVGFYEQRDKRLSVYREKWQEIKAILSDAPRYAEVEEMLREAGLNYSDFKKLYGEDKLKEAQLYGKDLKDRYTVLWTCFDIFS